MTEGIWIAIIGSLTSIISLILIIINGVKMTKIHDATNSMKDALVAAALIEGKRMGVEKQKALQAVIESAKADQKKEDSAG